MLWIDEIPSVRVEPVVAQRNPAWAEAIHLHEPIVTEDTAVTVAIIDTEVLTTHVGLPGPAVLQQFKVSRLLNNDGLCTEGSCCEPLMHAPPVRALADFHGTAVAGTIAGRRNARHPSVRGIATPTRVIAITPYERNLPREEAIAAAFHYALEQKANIINFSIESAPGILSLNLRRQLDAAARAGVLVVMAAGNSGTDLDKTPLWPASYRTATSLTVATMNMAGDSFGSSAYGTAVDLVVPLHPYGVYAPSGHGINHYTRFGQTSAAAAIVSGAATAMLRHPNFARCSAAEIKRLLMRFASRIDSAAVRTKVSVTGGVLNLSALD